MQFSAHAAGKTQILESGLVGERPEQAEHDFFEQRLQRGREVVVLRARAARPADAAVRIRVRACGEKTSPMVGAPLLPRHVDAFAVVHEVREIELEAAVRLHAHELAKTVEILRLAVRRQAHDLEFVAVLRETRGTA